MPKKPESGGEDDVIVPNPANASHRSKAYKLRTRVRAGHTLMPKDSKWLGDYEAAQEANGAGPDPAFGASASERVIHVEERKAAVGTGDAAAHAAAAGAMVREEGRRLDALVQVAINTVEAAGKIIERAGAMYAQMAAHMLARNQQLEDVHLSMLDTVREHYIARVEAEGTAAKAGEGGDDMMKQVMEMIQVANALKRDRPAVSNGKPPAG